MDLIAYGDESVRRTELAEPAYILGAWVRDEEGADLADQLAVHAPEGGKLHWRDHVPRMKHEVCQMIAAAGARHLVVVAKPLPERGGEERARQRALSMLCHVLEQDYDVRALVLERRQRQQDQKDQQTVNAARKGRVLSQGFRLTHEFGRSERRLWVPDQVVGALGDHLAGQDTGWLMMKDLVRVEEVVAQ
ncbi:hypothetical protein CHIBA101_2333 [Actinomyces sp. Chiba101]|uniref:hypothetical protein n=1 Tax=Actinomyces TaxID=1654 RepID=UPI000974DCD4|nr:MULTISPECIES: hypothetical protein [Actinomyces]BAW94154.1 hypothetical protein CHIBA101_2333 [Actinomyces sp. Chiba101]GAV95286.1 hypothetical protein ADENT20671_2070 [Actinomyces denticolens]